MTFVKDFDLSKAIPASYNPRVISDAAFLRLQQSLQKFGVCKPIILNKDLTILAGHQRCKAMNAVGIKTCPAFVSDVLISKASEVWFNVTHNMLELETSRVVVHGITSNTGLSIVDPDNIEVLTRSTNMNEIKEFCFLLTRYGEFGAVTVASDGMVLHNADYAVAVKLCNKKLHVYSLPEGQDKEFVSFLSADYGEYNYQGVGTESYSQTYAQPPRTETALHSFLYDDYVKPELEAQKDKLRILDFGAGKMVMPRIYNREGWRIICYEPFLRAGERRADKKFDIYGIVSLIKAIERDVAANGLYDVVILDSVINSVENKDFAHHVLIAVNALLKQDGALYFYTRGKFAPDKAKTATMAVSRMHNLYAVDKNGFSSNYMQGQWVMQYFLDVDGVKELLAPYFSGVFAEKHKAYVFARAKYPVRFAADEYRKSLDMEFNMEYPGGYKHNKQVPLVNAVLNALEKEVVNERT